MSDNIMETMTIENKKIIKERPLKSPKQRKLSALLQCPDCRRSVSSEALTCPKCGRPLQDHWKTLRNCYKESGYKKCPYCGEYAVKEKAGPHTTNEILLTIALMLPFAIPAGLYVLCLKMFPFCLWCSRRMWKRNIG